MGKGIQKQTYWDDCGTMCVWFGIWGIRTWPDTQADQDVGLKVSLLLMNSTEGAYRKREEEIEELFGNICLCVFVHM